LPLHYRDPGAFDRRAFLARQDIHLLATLRASVLLEKTATAVPSLHSRIAAARSHLRQRLDAMFAASPQAASVLRAMLLGDRSFVDRAESVNFQKTGTFHVLVVAGLHVGVLAAFLFWAGRALRVPRLAHTVVILVVLSAYVIIVEQRAPACAGRLERRDARYRSATAASAISTRFSRCSGAVYKAAVRAHKAVRRATKCVGGPRRFANR